MTGVEMQTEKLKNRIAVLKAENRELKIKYETVSADFKIYRTLSSMIRYLDGRIKDRSEKLEL